MSSSFDLLNRLLTIHYRSLLQYFVESGTWRGAGTIEDDADRAVRSIVFDQQRSAARIAELIGERHGAVLPGSYPMEFTDKNFLALDYMIGEALEAQRREVTLIEAVLFALPTHDRGARELTQECLGAAKAHVETLQALAAKLPV